MLTNQACHFKCYLACVLILFAKSSATRSGAHQDSRPSLQVRDLLVNRRFSSKEQRRSLVEQSAHNANEILGIYERIKSQENEPEANSLDQKSGLVLKDCAEKKCHNRGYCDYQVGECRCRGGWTGPSCDIPFFRTCLEGHSRCPGECDDEIGYCYCGRNTSHPSRLLPFHCKPVGFPGGTLPVEDIFGKMDEKTKQAGWCEAPSHYPAPPPDLPAQNMSRKCPCVTDGYGGDFCDTPHKQFCLNGCSNNGNCMFGFCKCLDGYFGEDCSLTAAKLLEFRKDQARSPKIFVYSMPQDYTGHQLVYRVDKTACVPYLYTDLNEIMYGPSYYSLETLLHQHLLSSPHRTLDPDEADYFFIPVYSSCHIYPVWRFAKEPDYAKECTKRVVSAMRLQKKAFDYVRENFPYYNRTQGRNHMIMALHDEGACWMHHEVYQNMTVIVHWGNSIAEPHSTSAFLGDRWDNRTDECPSFDANGNEIPGSTAVDEIGKHRCFTPEKDIVIPAWKIPGAIIARPDCGENRQIKVFFAGNWGEDRDPRYSMGIRQKVYSLHRDRPGWMLSTHTDDYQQDLCNSTFCLVMPGDGWSARFEDAVTSGCIPVIIQDNIYVPFEGWLDVSSIAIRVAEADIERLHEIIDSVSPERIAELSRNNALAAKYFIYSSQWRTIEKSYQISVKDISGNKEIITPDSDARHLIEDTVHANQGMDIKDPIDFLIRIIALKAAGKNPNPDYSTV